MTAPHTPPPAGPPDVGRHHVAPTGLGGSTRYRVIPALGRDGSRETVRRRRDVEIAVATVVGMSAVLSGPWIWTVALLVAAATASATFRLLVAPEPADAEHGIPVECLIVPAVAAFGSATAVHLVSLGPLLIPIVILVGLLLDRSLAVEARIAVASHAPSEEDRTESLVTMLVVALVAFAGVAVVVPGGLAGTEPPGAPVGALPLADLVVLVLADAAVAGLLGYRAAALRTADARSALLSAAGYALMIGVGAAAVRALGLPLLIGPAVLMFLFYLWDTLHSAPRSRRRDPRWLWETAILIGIGVIVVAWNVRLAS